MAFLQVKDILKRAVEFHKKLIDFYSKIENVSEKESVKLLVDYMARHESILKDELSKISTEQEQQLLNEWVKYDLELVACRCFESLKIDKNSSVDDVIDAGLELNQCLIDYYHHMSEIAAMEDMKALFANLEVMEIAEKKKLARMRGM
ncbi:MAG: hypothetical protein ACE5JK_05365 [Candidatus Omnitrophota bacterium]